MMNIAPSHAGEPFLSDLVSIWLQEKIGGEYMITAYELGTAKQWRRLCVDGLFLGYINNVDCVFTRGYVDSVDEPIYAGDPDFFDKVWAHIESVYGKARFTALMLGKK